MGHALAQSAWLFDHLFEVARHLGKVFQIPGFSDGH
jgi:hypothetical protein